MGLARTAKRLGWRAFSASGPARAEWRVKLAKALAGGKYSSPGASVGTRLRLARRGFLPVSRTLYDLGQKRRLYLSDHQRDVLTRDLNGESGALLDDKLAFGLLLERAGAPVVAVRSIVHGGRLHPIEDGPRDWDGLRTLLDARGRLVVKPVAAGGGDGVQVLASSGAGYELNGREADWREIEHVLRPLGYHAVTDHVQQAGWAHAIFPGSANTIRILTLCQERPLIAAAVLRVGTLASAPVDNWSRGGLSVRVDLETGELGRGVSYPANGALAWHARHPDTGEQIEGVRVPGWRALRDSILQTAERLSFIPYVGWDIVPTDDGHRVLEGNKFSDVNLLQVHGPLLADSAVREFYERHGVLS